MNNFRFAKDKETTIKTAWALEMGCHIVGTEEFEQTNERIPKTCQLRKNYVVCNDVLFKLSNSRNKNETGNLYYL